MHDVVGGGEVEPRAAGFQGERHEGHPLVLLKAIHEALAALDARAPVQHKAGVAEAGLELGPQGLDHGSELSEHQDLLLPGGDGLAQLGEPHQLAAGLGVEVSVP